MSDFNEVYLNQPIRFSEGQCKYLNTTYSYMKYAHQASEEYERIYKGYKDFKVFSNTGIVDGYKLLGRYIEIVVRELIALGFYDVNTKVLTSEYGEFICEEWVNAEKLIDELCKASGKEIAEAEQYRAMRKATRGKLVGGGFGVKGAAKGIALAGAFNAVSGLAHSGVNAIGNSNTRVTQQRKLNDIYNSNEMLQYLKQRIEISVQKMGAVLLEYQNLYLAENIVGNEAMKERVRALRSNYFRVPDDDKPCVAVQMLMLDPTDLGTYEFLLQKYGDRDGVLHKLSKVIGFSAEYEKIMFKFRESAFKGVKNGLTSQLEQLQISQDNHGKIDEILNEYEERATKTLSYFGGNFGIDTYLGELNQYYVKQLSELQETKFERLLSELEAEMKSWGRSDYSQNKILELKNRYYEKANVVVAVYGGDITSRPYYGRINSAIEKQLRSFLENKYLSTQGTNSTNGLTLVENDLCALQEDIPDFLKDTVDESLKKVRDIIKRVDLEERTFLGTTFDTVEERQRAEKDYLALNQKYLAVFSIETLPPCDKLKQLDNMRQEIEKNAELAPCVKNKIMSQVDPSIKKLIKEEQERRTFKGKMFDSEEECNTVKQDYKKLTEKFKTPNSQYTLADLKSRIKDCKNGNYHPVASQFALELLEPLAKKMRKDERAKRRATFSLCSCIVYVMFFIFILLTKPVFYENGKSQTLMDVVGAFVSNDMSMHITLGNGAFMLVYTALLYAILTELKEKGADEANAGLPAGMSLLLGLVWLITLICRFFGADYYCASGFYWLLFGGLVIGIGAYIVNELYQ